MLKWAVSQGCRVDAWAFRGAAKGGHIEVLKWLRGRGYQWSDFCCINAAKYGHLEVLKWLRSQGCPFRCQQCYKEAFANKHTDVTKWIESIESPQNYLSEWELKYRAILGADRYKSM